MTKKTIQAALALAAFIIAFLLFTHVNIKPRGENEEGYAGKEIENEEQETGYAAEAAKWYYEQRAFPLGYIPNDWRNKAFKHIAEFNQPNSLAKTTQTLSWSSLGPGNIGGRIRAIVVSPTDPDTVYVGSVSGGIWKTTNGGSSWFPLDDHMANLTVCSMVMDPENHNIIYAGTGEGFNNYDALQGDGIFKTTDAGATWTQLSSTNNSNFYFVNRLAIDSTNGALYAATRYGLFKSLDYGGSFKQMISFNQIGNTGSCLDIVISYTTPTTIYASFGLFVQSQIWRSTDGGNNFSFNFKHQSSGRIEMASSPSNPLVAYASFMDSASNDIHYMAVTRNGGNSWSSIIVPGPSSEPGGTYYTASQGWYNNALAVDPDTAASIYAAGIDVWKAPDFGINWTPLSYAYNKNAAKSNVHADIHALVFAPSNHNIIYLGCDGGIYKSTDRGNNWAAINNNLFITQFYSGAVAPAGSPYFGGAQDNYTLMGSSIQWREVLGGDGGDVNVDYSNPNIVYTELPNFGFMKSTTASPFFSYAQTGIPVDANHESLDRTLFITPVTMDPNNPQILLAGTYRVYRTINGAARWGTISSDLTGDGSGSQGNNITAVIAAKGNSSVIYAACSNGKIWVTQNTGSAWTEIDGVSNSGTPYGYITNLATDPTDPGTLYVTYSGYTSGAKVFKATNYGQSWTNISSNLPNIPVDCIVVNPNNLQNLIIGTDLGIFTTYNGGASWSEDNGGLANVAVFDLDYCTSNNSIYAATHGRGMFMAQLAPAGVQASNSNIPTTFQVYQNYPNPFNPTTIIQYSLPQAKKVRIVVYDISGKEIALLADKYQNAGTYNVTWNGNNNSGQPAASGIYFYTVQAGNYAQTKKMVLLK